MPDIRQQIEDILIKDLPYAVTCQYCERDTDWDFDLDRVVDHLTELINGKGVIDCPNNNTKETLWDRIELERRLGK